MAAEWQAFYRGRSVVVLGGAGFLGSHIVERLVELEAQVTVVDALVPGSGGRWANVEAVASQITTVHDNYGHLHRWTPMLKEGGLIIHCATFNTHRWSNEHPLADAQWNYLPACALAEFLQRFPPSVRLLYASTRTVYAPTRARYLTERHRVAPRDVYSFHSWASERLFLALNGRGHRVAVLRLPHLYGPRQRLEGVEIGFIGELLRAAVRDEPYDLVAHGEVYRDMLYVADAVEAFLRLGAQSATGVFNVPGSYVAARTLAQILESLLGWGKYRLLDTPAPSFPPLSGRRLQRTLGWLPQTPLHEGLRQTLGALRQL